MNDNRHDLGWDIVERSDDPELDMLADQQNRMVHLLMAAHRELRSIRGSLIESMLDAWAKGQLQHVDRRWTLVEDVAEVFGWLYRDCRHNAFWCRVAAGWYDEEPGPQRG